MVLATSVYSRWNYANGQTAIYLADDLLEYTSPDDESCNRAKYFSMISIIKTNVIKRIRNRRAQPELSLADFVLTISTEEATLPQGEGFKVNVELKNTSGDDLEILHSFLFWPHIPNWHFLSDDMRGISIDPPEPRIRHLEASGVLRNIELMGNCSNEPWLVGVTLEPGTHELRFRASFNIYFGQDSTLAYQPVEVWSNTIILTVQ